MMLLLLVTVGLLANEARGFKAKCALKPIKDGMRNRIESLKYDFVPNPKKAESPTIFNRLGDYLTNITIEEVTLTSFKLIYKENIGLDFYIGLYADLSSDQHSGFTMEVIIGGTIKLTADADAITTSLYGKLNTTAYYINYNFPEGFTGVTNVLIDKVRGELETSVLYAMKAVLHTSIDEQFKTIKERISVSKDSGCIHSFQYLTITADEISLSIDSYKLNDDIVDMCDFDSDEGFYNIVLCFIDFSWNYAVERESILHLIPSLSDIVSANAINFTLTPRKIPHCTKKPSGSELQLELQLTYHDKSQILLKFEIEFDIIIEVSVLDDRISVGLSEISEESLQLNLLNSIKGCNCQDAATSLRQQIMEIVAIYIQVDLPDKFKQISYLPTSTIQSTILPVDTTAISARIEFLGEE